LFFARLDKAWAHTYCSTHLVDLYDYMEFQQVISLGHGLNESIRRKE